MRASALIAGVLGVAAGFGAEVILAPRGDQRAPTQEAAPASGAPSSWRDCLARLDAIDAKLALLAVTAAAPSRVAADEPSGASIEQRIAAIEAALAQLAEKRTAAAKVDDASPRRPKDAAAIARLYEVEHGKMPERADDHQGLSADRLYDRYGAPDLIEGAGSDKSTKQFWVYFDSSDDHGIYFELQNGVVVRSWAYAR